MPKPPKPKFVPPKALGACADLLYTTRQMRLADQKVIAEYETRESALKEHIIAVLPVSELRGIAGKIARATITSKTIPIVSDWAKFYAYMIRKKRGDLLQRRLNEEAIKELWDAGIDVPGVEPFVAKGVSVTKL